MLRYVHHTDISQQLRDGNSKDGNVNMLSKTEEVMRKRRKAPQAEQRVKMFSKLLFNGTCCRRVFVRLETVKHAVWTWYSFYLWSNNTANCHSVIITQQVVCLRTIMRVIHDLVFDNINVWTSPWELFHSRILSKKSSRCKQQAEGRRGKDLHGSYSYLSFSYRLTPPALEGTTL